MSPDLLAGRYELTEMMASGGMGKVWKGRDRVLERIVAVKTVDLSAQDDTARERFRREAVATAGLVSPNIVQVFDAGVDGTTAYLVMELLTGPTLSRVIHDHGPLSVPVGLHVSREVARALLTAHQIGVVHRDIKPGNVMYHHDQVKLVDFGIAQLARNMGAALTAPATALGTAAYMSPEQATGEGATDKSDWYALGCLMTTIFTGEPPFKGEALAVASQQINSRPPYLSDRRPDIPPALDQLVARLLAKDPAERPTGAEVVDQLRLLEVDPNAGTVLLPVSAPGTALLPELPAAAGLPDPSGHRRASFSETPPEPPPPPRMPVVPAPPPPPQRVAPAPRRRRSVWPAILVVLLLLALGLGGAYFLLGDRNPVAVTPSPTATVAPTPTRAPTTTTRPTPTRRTPTPEQTTTRPTPTADTPSFSPSGDNQQDQAAAAVQSAINQVQNRAARSVLDALWIEAQVSGSGDRLLDMTKQLEDQRLITSDEGKAVEEAVKDWDD